MEIPWDTPWEIPREIPLPVQAVQQCSEDAMGGVPAHLGRRGHVGLSGSLSWLKMGLPPMCEPWTRVGGSPHHIPK